MVDRALAEWKERARGRFAGLGVPYRPEDERLLALRRFIAGTPLERRPYGRLHAHVEPLCYGQSPVPKSKTVSSMSAPVRPSRLMASTVPVGREPQGGSETDCTSQRELIFG